MNYVVCLGTIVLVACIYLIFRKFFEKHLSLTLKIFVLITAAVFLARYTVSSDSLFDASTSIAKNGNLSEMSAWLSYV
ncbi:MAG: hypothetical protein LUD72_14275, partial [Bacteroidales bacterium]|nr:hypothetical protein [Bacteroidales bacterium]